MAILDIVIAIGKLVSEATINPIRDPNRGDQLLTSRGPKTLPSKTEETSDRIEKSHHQNNNNKPKVIKRKCTSTEKLNNSETDESTGKLNKRMGSFITPQFSLMWGYACVIFTLALPMRPELHTTQFYLHLSLESYAEDTGQQLWMWQNYPDPFQDLGIKIINIDVTDDFSFRSDRRTSDAPT